MTSERTPTPHSMFGGVPEVIEFSRSNTEARGTTWPKSAFGLIEAPPDRVLIRGAAVASARSGRGSLPCHLRRPTLNAILGAPWRVKRTSRVGRRSKDAKVELRQRASLLDVQQARPAPDRCARGRDRCSGG